MRQEYIPSGMQATNQPTSMFLESREKPQETHMNTKNLWNSAATVNLLQKKIKPQTLKLCSIFK